MLWWGSRVILGDVDGTRSGKNKYETDCAYPSLNEELQRKAHVLTQAYDDPCTAMLPNNCAMSAPLRHARHRVPEKQTRSKYARRYYLENSLAGGSERLKYDV